MDILLSSGLAGMATFLCIFLLRPIAGRLGLVDRPGGRKIHETEIPLIGGIAMFFGFTFALLSLPISMSSYRGMFAGAGLLLLIGVLDDLHELSSKLRLFGQFLAAFIMIFWGHEEVRFLGNLFSFGNITTGYWAFPLTAVVVVAFINAMNMIDGQDGLAGGVAFFQVLLLLIVSLHLEHFADARMLILLAVALAIFLSFNLRTPWRKSASVFMGDAGSTTIAFLIAWFAVELAQANVSEVSPLTIVWILAFPLFDLINVMLSRIMQGQSPFRAGRDHIHHDLHLRGVDGTLSTLILTLFSLFLGVLGVCLNLVGLVEAWQLIILILVLVIYLAAVRIVRNK